MTEAGNVLADLAAEGDALDAVVAELPSEAWATPTPAEGWTVAHQIGHLAWTDDVAVIAATDPDAFGKVMEQALADPEGLVDAGAVEMATLDPRELLARWREGRARLVPALAAVTAGSKLPWFGPPMSATSMATARLMETWAHGQDVVDALGVDRPATARLRNVAHIGVRARGFAYMINDLALPDSEPRVELTGPDGELWTWGPEDADQRVSGPALDFCLLVTRRRHRDDLAVAAVGGDADQWLDIAQAFAGPPGQGRAPRQGGTSGRGRVS